MNNESNNQRNEVRMTGKTSVDNRPENKENEMAPQNEGEVMANQAYSEDNLVVTEEKKMRRKIEKPLKTFGVICIIITIITFMLYDTATPKSSESVKNALKNKTSTAISAGTVLLASDEKMNAQDYTIEHKTGSKDTRIWVWDYAAEDGDYVQVLVNDTAVSDSFMIRHKPRELTVPSIGKVQIKGIRDGGGGITYAVRYEVNGTSYFNGTPEGKLNTYTLKNK